ncbi:uncharacterized protein (DUF1697 family) [Amorphus suaedae]
MTVFIALLRAVNVGGTGKLAMADLCALCAAIGFDDVRTYIQSGNVVFRTEATADAAREALERRVSEWLGKSVGVMLRDAEAMRDVLARNPFRSAAPNRVAVLFLNEAPPPDLRQTAKGQADEEIAVGDREVYIHYPSGMGRSRLRVPVMEFGTARNLNTVARLAEMATTGS